MKTWTGPEPVAPLTGRQRRVRTLLGVAAVAAFAVGWLIPFGWWLP